MVADVADLNKNINQLPQWYRQVIVDPVSAHIYRFARARTYCWRARARMRTRALVQAQTHSLPPRVRVHAHSFPSGASELNIYWFCLPL
jgi:hypothetical protein